MHLLWTILKAASALYAVALILGIPLLLAMCKNSGRISRQEEFEAHQQWKARRLEEERELYRH